MKPLISVVVPVYGVEKYLPKCVDSILNQSYQNLEILLVDDGSPDNCGKLCDSYAEKDSRIRVIHQKNGGLSAARNAGVAAAKGEYISLIDSDDHISPNMYARMYDAIRENGAQLCICAMRWVHEDGSLFAGMERGAIQDEVLTKEEAFQKLHGKNGANYVTAVNKLYHKSLFDTVAFPVGRIHEDEFTVHLFMAQCEKIVCIGEELYFYVQRAGSITNSSYTIRKLDGVRAMWARYRFFQKNGFREEAAWALRAGSWLYDAMLDNLSVLTYFPQMFPWVLRLSLHLFPQKVSLQLAWKFARRLLRCMYQAAADEAYYLRSFFGSRSRVVILATPVHGNLGDQAIVAAERAMLTQVFPKSKLVEIPNDLYLKDPHRAERYVKKEDTVIIDGGGNLGTLWPDEDDKITGIIEAFPDNRIIVFPQTCYYDPSADNTKRLEKNRKAYENAKHLTVMLRDRASYGFFTRTFAGVDAVFTPDIVLSLQPKLPPVKRQGVLFCFRNDRERVLQEADMQQILGKLDALGVTSAATSTVVDRPVTQQTRQEELQRKWEEFASARLVITDRLHAMLFAAITGTPCVAVDNKSKKVGGAYEWLQDMPCIRYCENVSQVCGSIEAALAEEISAEAYRFPEKLIVDAIHE